MRSRPLSLLALCAALSIAALVGEARTQQREGTPARPVAGRPWMDARLSTDARARALLAQMSPDEKFWQLFMSGGELPRDAGLLGHGMFGIQLLSLRNLPAGAAFDRAVAARTNEVQRFFVERTRLGIPAVLFEEGLHGLIQDGATIFPQAIGLAATWDPALVGRVATEIARQSRESGVRQLLSPVVNLARDQRWGRVEETYGEDSWLSAAMGLAYVRAVEQAGVVATPKHFAVNNGDGGRDSYPVSLDSVTLADLHFPPFRAAIQQGHARSVMSSYNSVNGVPASANSGLLTRTLRGEWGFGGVVISDAGAVGGANVLHYTSADYAASTARSVRAGNDVIFQEGARDAPLFRDAFRRGMVPRAVLDAAVLRVLRLKFELGLFDHPYVDEATANSAAERAAARLLARQAAEESVVLLRNEHGTLPLVAGRRRVAVIGGDAVALPFGDYSARSRVPVSLVDAMRRRLGAQGTVLYAPGPGRGEAAWVPVDTAAMHHAFAGIPLAGLRGEYFNNASWQGSATTVRTDRLIDFNWTFYPPAPGLRTEWYSVRWTGTVEVPPGDSARLAVEADDGLRLWIDGALVIDADRKVSYGLHVAPQAIGGGRRHTVRLEYRQTSGPARVRLLWDRGHAREADERMAAAVKLARDADVVVVTAGIFEGEGRDRSSLHLPGRQADLIALLAATGKPVVVILIAGGAVIATPWLERAAAVLQAFYPGEAGAEALARVLFGDANPSGRLPYTVPHSEGQLPLVYDHLPTGRGDDYVDLTGQPLFPFGFGLSYTTFAYRDLALSAPRAGAGDTVRVRCFVRNTGRRAGDEVVQLYVRHETAPTAQPVLSLRGFTRVTLRPGEERLVELALPVNALAVRDERGRREVVDGTVVLYVGSSARDLRLRGSLRTRGASR